MDKTLLNESYYGWAIILSYMPSLAGIYFEKSLPHRLMGCKTLVYRTREQARKQLKNMSTGGKVVRVIVTIELAQ